MAIKTLADLRWVPLFGNWEQGKDDVIVFRGRETSTLIGSTNSPEEINLRESGDFLVSHGQIVFNQRFTEGSIKAEFTFVNPDHRSNMAIVLQTNITNNNLLMFGLTGGFIKFDSGTGYLYSLRRYGISGRNSERSAANALTTPIFSDLFRSGEGKSLRGGIPYQIEISVKGAVISASVDGVEIMRHTLDQPSLLGEQIGLFGGSRSDITVSNIQVVSKTPKAFVIMQFNTEEYEALYEEVIAPLCVAAGLQPYRGDSTFLPGIIIDDIKKQIEEARVVIAEVTPNNANVYFEVGYANALRKPIILIADRKEGLKPFDVRAYRTLFYDNSIGGKRRVETDLKLYLDSILGK